MFGNRTATVASILQKTYDESYLTCSTAVYYESQVGTRQLLGAGALLCRRKHSS